MPKVEKMDLDSSLKETITYESQMLHYGLYTAGYQRVFQADIPWHWHDEFELGYISGGSVVYQTSGLTVTLHEGDGIFINSGVLHYLHPLEPAVKPGFRLNSLISPFWQAPSAACWT